MQLPDPTPLPEKSIFRRHGVRIGQVAEYVGLSYAYVSNTLNGHTKPSKHSLEKFRDLAEKLQKGEIHV